MARHLREITRSPELPAPASLGLPGIVVNYVFAVIDEYYQLYLRVKGIIPS